jgi:hypothetical protein
MAEAPVRPSVRRAVESRRGMMIVVQGKLFALSLVYKFHVHTALRPGPVHLNVIDDRQGVHEIARTEEG